MPSRKASKYTKDQNTLWQGEILSILIEHSDNALSISDIQACSFTLNGLTTQKIARLLGHLVEMGSVVKAKSRAKNKMVYKIRDIEDFERERKNVYQFQSDELE